MKDKTVYYECQNRRGIMFNFSIPDKHYFNDKPIVDGYSPFSGVVERWSDGKLKSVGAFINGIAHGKYVSIEEDEINIGASTVGITNGYSLVIDKYTDDVIRFGVWDMNFPIESYPYYKIKNGVFEPIFSDKIPLSLGREQDNFQLWLETSNALARIEAIIQKDVSPQDFETMRFYFGLESKDIDEFNFLRRAHWAYYRSELAERGHYEGDNDFLPYYYLQNELVQKVITTDMLPAHHTDLRYIGLVSIAFCELALRMVACIVLWDKKKVTT